MENRGCKVLPVKCDVSNEQDVIKALKQIREVAPIAGVIHSAGVLSDAMVLNQTVDSFKAVFAPKAQGAWNLHQATLADDLDHFVLFSSIAGELGSPGQSNHAAANTFLDGLSAYRKGLGLPALSINWGPWDEIGAAIRHEASRHAYAEAFGLIPPAIGMQKFAELWHEGEHSRIGVMSFDPSRLPLEARQKPLFDLLRTDLAIAPPSKSGQTRFRLEDKTPAEAGEALRDYLKQKVSRILCLDDEEQVGQSTALFDLGLDSLTTMELKDALQTELEIALKPTVFFDYPTLKALADFLLKTLLDRRAQEEAAKSPVTSDPAPGPGKPSRPEATEPNRDQESSMRQKLIEISNELSQWDDNCCD
jgi:acyl carrier protein